MKTSRLLRSLPLALSLAAPIALGDDKDLLKRGNAPPNVMVILSNTDSMKYMPYLQGSVPNLPGDGQYGDSPVSKFGLAKAAFNQVVQKNKSRFNFGLSWYSYHQESVSHKYWSYQFQANQADATATEDYPGDAFAEKVGTYEEWGTNGGGPILSTTGGVEVFGISGTTLVGPWFGDSTRVSNCDGNNSDTCRGWAVETISDRTRVVSSLVPVSGNQPYGEMSVTVEKHYQTATVVGANKNWSDAVTPRGNASIALLTYVPAAGTPALPNVYSGNAGADANKYMGFMKSGDWNLNSDCGGWFVKADLPAINIPRDYTSDAPACTITTCSVPAEDSFGCVLRYTRPQSVTIHFDQGNGAYRPQFVPDPAGSVCSSRLVNSSLTNEEDQVILITDHDSHIPEANMFKNVDDFFSGGAGDCWGNGIRSDDPAKTCRTGAVILLSDTFDACGPDCSQTSTSKYLVSLKQHHVPVYVISFGDLDNGSATANEAHCIATTSGSETTNPPSQGVFFVSSTDPSQVALDLQAAFDAILTKIDEAVEDFASATVSSVQAGNGQMAFLATFNARKFRSVWDGALRGFVLSNDGAINPTTTGPAPLNCAPNTNPSDCTPCTTTIKDPNDPQLNVSLTVPCNDPSILKWNVQINLAKVPVTGGVPDLTAGMAIQNGTYQDTSNDLPAAGHTIATHTYNGRRIIWSLPATVAAGATPTSLPINGSSTAGAEAVPETTYKFINDSSQTWFPKLKALLTPQNSPPSAGTLPCVFPSTPPCTITDTDALQTIRFIRGDRDSVIDQLRAAQGKQPFVLGDAHYYTQNSLALKMGDIFHSNPQLIGEPENFFYFSSDAHNYTDFFNKYKHRRRVLYTGGNDGLLHAFDVGVFGRNAADCTGNSTTCYDFGTGAELFAYAPRSVMQNFKRLKDVVAAQQPTDEWTVDGAPAASDMFIDTNHNGTPVAGNRAWRTIVVGSQREGSPFEGQTVAYDVECKAVGSPTPFQNNASSVYALDVTAPEPLDGTGNERAGTYASPGCLDGGGSCPSVWPKVLWEFQDTTQTNGGFYDMGESWSKPGLGRICVTRSNAGACTDERFVAIFGGGFDRERLNRRGNWLYIVDVETGFVLYKVDRGTSSLSPAVQTFGSMPSEPSAIDYNGDGFLDVVYIGDMLGQLWRLDLTDVKLPSGAPTARFASKLTKGDGTALQPFLVFQAPQDIYVAGNAGPFQNFPIYYRPTIVSLGLSGSTGTPKLGLAFGTGDRDDVGAKCPTISSNITRSTSYNQRFYFVVDDSNTTTRKEADLYPIATSSTANTTTVPPNGWYLKLGTNNLTTAERVITNSLAANKYIYFFTVTPASSPNASNCPPPSNCSGGTLARAYVVYYANGNYLTGPDRGTFVPNSSFATDPIFYISGNNQGNVGYTTNHGAFNPTKSQTGTRGTLKNWKEQ